MRMNSTYEKFMIYMEKDGQTDEMADFAEKRRPFLDS